MEPISGTHGKVFLDDEEVAELKAFQAKEEYGKEEWQSCGSMIKRYKITSIDCKGSLTFGKVDSTLIKKVLKEVRKGITPKFSIIGVLDDPNVLGCERVAFNGVVFDDLTIFDFETAVLGSIEAPFTYEDITPLDLI